MDENETNETTPVKKGLSALKAKDASLVGQIVAAVWIAGWSVCNFAKQISAGNVVDTNDIIKSGISIAVCFCPVYFSILMDKLKGDK